jgi:hypothetical protein
VKDRLIGMGEVDDVTGAKVKSSQAEAWPVFPAAATRQYTTSFPPLTLEGSIVTVNGTYS